MGAGGVWGGLIWRRAVSGTLRRNAVPVKEPEVYRSGTLAAMSRIPAGRLTPVDADWPRFWLRVRAATRAAGCSGGGYNSGMNESNPYTPTTDPHIKSTTGCLVVVGWTFFWLLLLGFALTFFGILALTLGASTPPPELVPVAVPE